MDFSLPCPAADLKLKFHRSTKRLHCPTQPIAQTWPGKSSRPSSLFRVESAVLTVSRPLPLFPRKRIFSCAGGMSGPGVTFGDAFFLGGLPH